MTSGGGGGIRVFLVEDSPVFLHALCRALGAIPRVEVVGRALNGKAALTKLQSIEADLITLDIEMPVMDGLSMLKELRKKPSMPVVLMLSSLTYEGAEATIEALQNGATDFILKPSGPKPSENLEYLKRVLAEKIHAIFPDSNPKDPRRTSLSHANRRRSSTMARYRNPYDRESGGSTGRGDPPRRGVSAVGIGISTGGPRALLEVIPALPGDLPVPVFIVQHMPVGFTRSLADSLDAHSPLEVREAEDGDQVKPGTVYLAPGGLHMRITERKRIRLTEDPPVKSFRPSVDYMFHSLCEAYGKDVLAVIMTGMGSDGLEGCRELHRKGARILAQDEASSVVYGMPRVVIEDGIADRILDPKGISEEIAATVTGEVAWN